MERRIEAVFPHLRHTNWEQKSPQTISYNCIAWAAGETSRCWWPIEHPRYYWPEGILREETIERFIEVFQRLGYETCDDGELETGYEKVALYVDDLQVPTHMARQLETGVWSSKLGDWEDIEHHTLHGLENSTYGHVASYMKRPTLRDLEARKGCLSILKRTRNE